MTIEGPGVPLLGLLVFDDGSRMSAESESNTVLNLRSSDSASFHFFNKGLAIDPIS